MNLDFIKNDIILVVPNNIKINLLLALNKKDSLYNIKIMSLNELINKLTFTYNEEAIYYLMNKYNIKYEVSKIYLDNLKYIEDKKYNNEKLDKLVDIKKELIDNNLIIFDENINNLISNKEIIIYGYDHINKYELNILKKLNYKIIDKEYKVYNHDIYKFDYIDEEVEFIANKIIDLINSGININNIKIANTNNDYYNVLKRIFNLYNIPINMPNNSFIYDTNIVRDFLSLINENDINKSLEIISNKYDMNIKENNYIYNKIINILNKYTFIDDKTKIIDLLINDFKNTKNINEKYENAIEIIDIKNNIIDDNIYVFLLSFNQGNIPTIHKDENYINDSLSNYVEIETTKEKNKIEKEIMLNIIKSIKNLTITYKLKTPFDNYIISSLNDELNYEIKTINIENKHSNKMNYIHLGNYLDDFIKYGKKDSKLDILYNNYSDINYLTFDNKFKGIDKNDFNEYIDNKLLLSYSSLDNYYRCSFRYYLNNILKLTEFEETFYIKIGNIFHLILSKCFDDNFDFEKDWENSIKDIEFSISDKFFLKKLKEELKFVINTINTQNKFSSIKDSLYENKIYINKEGTIKLTFMGIIDKLLYKKENNNTYLVIIDYKTGVLHTNLNNCIHGINMQLPVYLYLSKEKFKDAKVIGFYLQKVINNEIIKQKNKTYNEIKKENLKLQGYSINNEEELSKFDMTYKSSEVIKSMKVGNNGFYAYSKTISEEEINKLIDIVKTNIDNAFKDILDTKFDINPKRIGKALIGCEFCKYKDICYMKEEDIVDKEEYKNLEFLK